MKTEFKVGDKITCKNNTILKGLEAAPPLILNEKYTVLQVIQDSKGNDHLDVGLVSTLNYVRSLETKEDLPDGNKIHWCHPSRFVL